MITNLILLLIAIIICYTHFKAFYPYCPPSLPQNTPRNYQPYDYVLVKEGRPMPDHVVMSSTGVTYVHPDAPTECLPLHQFQRERLLFRTISQLPFFKNFLFVKVTKCSREKWDDDKLMVGKCIM